MGSTPVTYCLGFDYFLVVALVPSMFHCSFFFAMVSPACSCGPLATHCLLLFFVIFSLHFFGGFFPSQLYCGVSISYFLVAFLALGFLWYNIFSFDVAWSGVLLLLPLWNAHWLSPILNHGLSLCQCLVDRVAMLESDNVTLHEPVNSLSLSTTELKQHLNNNSLQTSDYSAALNVVIKCFKKKIDSNNEQFHNLHNNKDKKDEFVCK